MSKTVVIHQPDFLSYAGFFHRLLHADLFVLLDCAQYVDGTRNAWMNRDKIKTPQGEKWLTVSVKRAPRNSQIREIELSDSIDWRAGNLNLLRENYKSAPFFTEIFPAVEELYAYQCEKLIDFNLRSIDLMLELFDIHPAMQLASALDPAGRKNDLLVDILGKVGATHYLSGTGAKAYFEPGPFERAGITVLWQEFRHPVYRQSHGDFLPYLSSIDLLFNCGTRRSREILRGC